MIHKQLIYLQGKLAGRQPSTIIPYEELTSLFFTGKIYLPLACIGLTLHSIPYLTGDKMDSSPSFRINNAQL